MSLENITRVSLCTENATQTYINKQTKIHDLFLLTALNFCLRPLSPCALKSNNTLFLLYLFSYKLSLTLGLFPWFQVCCSSSALFFNTKVSAKIPVLQRSSPPPYVMLLYPTTSPVYYLLIPYNHLELLYMFVYLFTFKCKLHKNKNSFVLQVVLCLTNSRCSLNIY